jgi:glutamyl-tRNA synthetase
VCSEEKAARICSVMKERVTFPKDFWNESTYFFIAPTAYDESVAASKWTEEAINVIQAYGDVIQQHDAVDATQAKNLLNEVLEKQGVKIGKVLQALRLAVTGVGAGPDLMFVIETIGPKETASRIEHALQALENFRITK